MKIDDIKYICETTSNLAGIPIRIYKNNNIIYFHSIVYFPKDPILPYEKDILAIDSHLGYYITPRFYYYGIVKSKDIKIVLGPSRQLTMDKNDLNELSFECDVPLNEKEDFIRAMNSLISMPLNSLIQTLCSINFVLNKEKLTLEDVMIYENSQEMLTKMMEKENENVNHPSNEINDNPVRNTMTLEDNLSSIVSSGNVAALKELLSSMPAIREGTLSKDQIRQKKNMFIVTVTLVSRAAIRGGMDANDALYLSDAYIQKSELYQNENDILNLQYHMILDYTERMSHIHLGNNPSKLITDVANYVHHHLSENIKTENIAETLYISRTHLSMKFKKETGITLSDFILKEKVQEGKRLLCYTDKPIISIASYLGFASQSHFTNVFKKYSGCTPFEYRNKKTN